MNLYFRIQRFDSDTGGVAPASQFKNSRRVEQALEETKTYVKRSDNSFHEKWEAYPTTHHEKIIIPAVDRCQENEEGRKEGRPTELLKISIITPSYNQGQFLEETVQSVLSQNYPNLEYIIIDGFSKDNSEEIIKKYQNKLSYWTSEPDRGQYHAINKGFRKSTGEIMAWLCSDDTYRPGALNFIGNFFLNNPNVDIILGGWDYVDSKGNILWTEYGKYNRKEFLCGVGRVGQPAVFWRRKVYETIGPLSEEFSYWMDGEYFLRMGAKFRFHAVKIILATYRLHNTSKSVCDYKSQMQPIAKIVIERYGGKYPLCWPKRLLSLRYIFAKGKHIALKAFAMGKNKYLLKHLKYKLLRTDIY